MKKTLFICMFSVWLIPSVIAQRQISGTVMDFSDKQSLPGVNVLIKGSSSGAITDMDGNYTIEVSGDETVLSFSFIGYETREEIVGSRSVIDVNLMPDIQQLGEVIVTALGIERERKALGYSVTQVKGESLTQARENNVMNSLVGKVPGLSINSTSGGVGSSSNILIRGVSSIDGNSQPLYVINGIPMESAPNGSVGAIALGNSGSQWDNAPDLGDAISNINPDDIESISVLKGAAASALYGYRAKAGVILITTKKATGSGIEFNSNYVAEQIIDVTDWQYVYGQGSNNRKPADAIEAAQVGQSSWGGLLDGSQVVQFDGVERPYTVQKDNLENFYRTGGSWTNTLAFNKSFEEGSLRLSLSDLANKSVVPNSGLDRQTFNLNGVFNPIKQLRIDARANYILEQVKNRAMLSDGAGNANYNVMFLPTSVDVENLKPGTNPDGSEFVYTTGNTFATNPWFAANNFVNDTDRKRLITSLSAQYTFDNGLFIQGRAGNDSYTDRYTYVVPSGTAYRFLGSMTEQTVTFSDLNLDALIGKSFTLSNDITINPNIGASYRSTKGELSATDGSDFSVFGNYNILNAANKSARYGYTELEVQSVYGSMEFSLKELLYLTVTGRQDWFSSLATPGFDNELGVFYPSVSGSFVFSELWKPSMLTFGKIRAGYATVGDATDPYRTLQTYQFRSETLNGFPLGTVKNANIPNSGLIASEAKEFEVGTELKFFQNRLGLDLTYYNKQSENEIVIAPVSSTTGYDGAVLNSGEMQNKGFEGLLTFNAIDNGDFTYTTSLNASVNDNEVITLAEGTGSLLVGTSRSGVGFIQHIPGEAAAQVMAYDYAYDEDGNILYTENGVPQQGELKPWGSAYHKWIAGWSNEFSYKGVNLGFLIDGKWGGKIFSATDYYGYVFGLHKETLEGREEGFGTTGSPINAATYYSTFAGNVSKDFVEDASFIKFRQLTLGYSFPAKLFNDKIQSLTLSLVARNLFILMKKTDNIDPESGYSAAVPGLELGGVPPTRTYGLNLNIKL